MTNESAAPTQERATASDRNTKPFEQPVTASWDRSISPSDLPKLLQGFEPKDMDDKWFVYADGLDTQGNGTIHMHRSWTGYKVIEAKFLVKYAGEGETAKEAHFTDITWESSDSKVADMTEEDAKQTATQLCNLCIRQ